MVESPIFTTGASVQQPRQATGSMVNCRCRIGVGARRNAQMPPQRILHPSPLPHMAGRAAADPDNMFARRLVAEHVVEGRNPGDGSGWNLGQSAEPFQVLLGQVAMMFLERLENRDQRLGFAPDLLHRLFDKVEVNTWHGRFKVGQEGRPHSPYFGENTTDFAKGTTAAAKRN